MNTIPELYNVVYMLTNPVGERYIGSAVDLRNRISAYRCGKSHGKIGESIAKYGYENHTLTILAHGLLDADLRAREYKFIDELQPELNLIKTTAGGQLRHAESTKRKQSKSMRGKNLGKKMPPRSPEYCAKISAANRRRKHSPETRAKMSASMSGERNPNYGKPRSTETKAKQSASLFGHEVTIKSRAKMSKSLREHYHKQRAQQRALAGQMELDFLEVED